jgi:hypothetical protein
MESYKVYLDKLDYVWKSNREMAIMGANSVSKYLAIQKIAFKRYLSTGDAFSLQPLRTEMMLLKPEPIPPSSV